MNIEIEMINGLQSSLRFDENIRRSALALFRDYQNNQKEQMDELSGNAILRCCILAESFTQVNTQLGVHSESQESRLSHIEIINFLLAPPVITMDFFMANLKKFVNFVHLEEQIHRYFKTLLQHFGFSLTIFKKYEEIFGDMEFKEVEGESEHVEDLKQIGWIIYILSRAELLQKKMDIVECISLLVAVFHALLIHLPQGVSSKLCIDGNALSMEERSQFYINIICKKLKFRANESVHISDLAAEIVIFLEKLKQDNTIYGSCICEDFSGIFDRTKIKYNQKRLTQLYLEKLEEMEFDERIFLYSELRARTPIHINPFTRQGIANKRFTPVPKGQNFNSQNKLVNSQRLLNFENPPTPVVDKMNLGSKLAEIKFPTAINSSPYSIKSFPQVTPISRAIEMNNWLQDHCLKVNLNQHGLTSNLTQFLQKCSIGIEGVILAHLNKLLVRISKTLEEDEKKSSKRNKQIMLFYFRVLDEMLKLEEKKTKSCIFGNILQNMAFHKAIIASCSETVLFVHNDNNIPFEKILILFDLSSFDFWKIINSFIKFDPMMPSSLKRHFRSIEVSILSYLGWKKESPVLQIIEQIIKEDKTKESKKAIRVEDVVQMDNMTLSDRLADGREKDKWLEETKGGNSARGKENIPVNAETRAGGCSVSTPSLPHELFFKRVLHLVAERIVSLGESLGLTEEIRENVWELMKHCLSIETNLLIDRHLDQLILCSLYAVSKIFAGKDTSFNRIIKTYIESSQDSTYVHDVYFKVMLPDGSHGDIIKFYNTGFIPRVKEFMFAFKSKDPKKWVAQKNLFLKSRPQVRALAPASPLRENMPPPLLHYSNIYSNTLTHSATDPRRGVSNSHKFPFLCSPLGVQRQKLTPRTKILYAFGESPSVSLENLNNRMKNRGCRKNKHCKTLNYKSSLMSKIVESDPRKEDGGVEDMPAGGYTMAEGFQNQGGQGQGHTHSMQAHVHSVQGHVHSPHSTHSPHSPQPMHPPQPSSSMADKIIKFKKPPLSSRGSTQNMLIHTPIQNIQNAQNTPNTHTQNIMPLAHPQSLQYHNSVRKGISENVSKNLFACKGRLVTAPNLGTREDILSPRNLGGDH